jgi:hypothetical protein
MREQTRNGGCEGPVQPGTSWGENHRTHPARAAGVTCSFASLSAPVALVPAAVDVVRVRSVAVRRLRIARAPPPPCRRTAPEPSNSTVVFTRCVAPPRPCHPLCDERLKRSRPRKRSTQLTRSVDARFGPVGCCRRPALPHAAAPRSTRSDDDEQHTADDEQHKAYGNRHSKAAADTHPEASVWGFWRSRAAGGPVRAVDSLDITRHRPTGEASHAAQ